MIGKIFEVRCFKQKTQDPKPSVYDVLKKGYKTNPITTFSLLTISFVMRNLISGIFTLSRTLFANDNKITSLVITV